MSLPPPPPPNDAPPPGWQGPGWQNQGWQNQGWQGQGWQGQGWQQPAPGWGNRPWAGAGPTMEHPQGTAVLLLGILGLVVCGILGPIAWRMGNAALREMDARPDVIWTNRSNVTAGRVCGMIASVLLLVGVAFFLLWLVFAVAVVSGT